MNKLATGFLAALYMLLALTSCAGGDSKPEERSPESLEIQFVGMDEDPRGAWARFSVRNTWDKAVYVYGMNGPGNFFSTRPVDGSRVFMMPRGYSCGVGSRLFKVDPGDEFFLKALLSERIPDFVVQMSVYDEAGAAYAECQSEPIMNPLRDRTVD